MNQYKREKDEKIKFPIQGTGNEKRAFIYIDDFVKGLMTVLENGKHMEIYHIGTMDEISIKDVAVEIGKYFRKQVEVVPGKLTEGSTPRRCPDTAKLKKLGFKPEVSFSKGLKMTAKWYDENASKMPARTGELS